MKQSENRAITKAYAYLYLSRLLGAGSNKLYDLLALRPEVEQLCRMTADDWRKTGLLTQGELRRVARINSDSIWETLDYCDTHDIRVITPEDAEYPTGFRSIENPPAILFARGLPLENDRPAIGIVGARKSTEFGQKAAYSLSAKLALAGFTVVSGGAVGIDHMAHAGALYAGGTTVAVLGCGIDSDYLPKQEALRRRVAEQGTLLSEFEPRTSATRYTFPIRNRLISALSCGVAVIEAGQKSGALITATYAMEQGREVFALPGGINQQQYAGTNALLRDGAIPLLSVEDIILVYLGRFSDTLKTDITPSAEIRQGYAKEAALIVQSQSKGRAATSAKKREPAAPDTTASSVLSGVTPPEQLVCSPAAKQVYAAFAEQTELSDTLSARSGIAGGAFIAAITELELMGYIKAVPVGRYERIK